MEYRYVFEVSASENDMDSWEDGREIKFAIDSKRPIINPDQLEKIINDYLEAVGVGHRDYQYRVAELVEPE